MYDVVRDAFFPFNEPLEARIDFMYLDVLSLVTTGIGNLIDADDPKAFGTRAQLLPHAYDLGWFDKDSAVEVSRDEIDEEYRTVKFSGTAGHRIDERRGITRLRISSETIDQLVRSQLNAFEATLKGRFPAFDDWPADAQLGLLSLAWAKGPEMQKFPKLSAALDSQDWLSAARESHLDETGNAGLRPRNVRNGILFTTAAWMAAPPPGDFSALVFDPHDTVEGNLRSGNIPLPMQMEVGIQAALERLSVALARPSYDPHGLDGAFGAATRQAITAFQADNQLTQTPDAKSVVDIGQETVDAVATALDAQAIAHFP